MRALTNKPRTEKQIEARFEGSYAEMVKLRRMAQTLRVKDLTEWALEEKEVYSPEEISPELTWNGGGVAIRGARGKEGLTQRQLAELTGIAQHHISEMENGKRPIGKETARRLADALNIDYRVFL
ncbi:helix-turn-helix domain-containing protein [Geomonas subterranea]|uniref:Helix-turn-helix domain-containing protein n=1 Tax=Geomonas subterranea TaxID=2847989 RepID=A0ABX8LDR2_9BACT|nr:MULTISPECIES: helix-turn-helix transcriptional regulator [Geomonas]QXE90183.1 helix-turn-helix domain-containing protein [Geomonas subterranea]QXM07691.1 helix-turn-helix domain-containing protein [Geomonas subterranea]